jgi:hypothetical protein
MPITAATHSIFTGRIYMEKILWLALIAHPFPQALILYIIGICCLVLPDIMSYFGLHLPWPLHAYIVATGFALSFIGFASIIMCHTALFAEFKEAYDARHNCTERKEK